MRILNISIFYNLRFRIVLAFTALSFFCALAYGLLSSFIYEVVNDQIFNWYALEVSRSIKKNSIYPQDEPNRKFLIGSEADLYNFLANNYGMNEPYDKKGFVTMEALDVKQKLNGEETLYEISFDEKKLHIIGMPYKKIFQFLIYDISGFNKINRINSTINDQNVLLLILPLTLFISVVGLILGLVLSKRIISPLTRLANMVSNTSPESINREVSSKYYYGEVATLADTINMLIVRTNNYIEHERRFSREVSHELRTPVTSIGMAINLLETTQLSDSQYKAFQRIKRANMEMAHLIQTFLMLGRETINNLDTSKTNIRPCIDESIEKNKHLLKKKDIEIIIDISDEDSLVVNKELFTIVASNLIRNAFQFTHGGFVKIAFNEGVLKIEDTGPGIPEKQIKNIYEPYQKLQPEGVGLGLSIVKRIASKLDWKIEINNTGQKGGTCVTVNF